MRSPFTSKLYAGQFLPCNKVHKISMKQEKGAGQWDNDTAFISLVPSSWQWIFDICIVNVVSPLCLQFHSSCSFSAPWLKFKKMAHFHSVGPKIFLVGPALCRWRYLWLPKVGSRSRLAWPIMLYYRHPLPLSLFSWLCGTKFRGDIRCEDLSIHCTIDRCHVATIGHVYPPGLGGSW